MKEKTLIKDIGRDHIPRPGKNRERKPWQSLIVHLGNARDRDDFSKLVGVRITPATKEIRFPADRSTVFPCYPFYARHSEAVLYLKKMGIRCKKVKSFSEAHLDSSRRGAERFWIIDAPIQDIYNVGSKDSRSPVESLDMLTTIEHYTDLFTNVAFVGFNPVEPSGKDALQVNGSSVPDIMLASNEAIKEIMEFPEHEEYTLRQEDARRGRWVSIIFSHYIADTTDRDEAQILPYIEPYAGQRLILKSNLKEDKSRNNYNVEKEIADARRKK